MAAGRILQLDAEQWAAAQGQAREGGGGTAVGTALAEHQDAPVRATLVATSDGRGSATRLTLVDGRILLVLQAFAERDGETVAAQGAELRFVQPESLWPGLRAALPPVDVLRAPASAVAERYASVLTAGDRSKHAATFTADDHLRQELRKSGRGQVAEIEEKDGEGSFKVAHEPADHPVKAVRTVDGGAMVLVALRSQETLRAEEGWQLKPVSSAAAALWGDADGTEILKTTYHDTVALYVPPAGSAAKVSLLGYHRVPYAVSDG